MVPASLAVLLVLGSAHASTVQSGTANQRAMTWLRKHQGESDPDAAGMNDLKNSDPNAFAIVQALLTKRSLGLLDPNNPSASMTGEKRPQQRSFKQEAEDAGVTADTPVSESSAALPFPSAGTSKGVALPFPEMSSEKDTQFGFHPNNDDAMVQSVLGAVDELKTHGSAFATKKSTTKMAADPTTPISLDWGNPHAGVDQPVSAHQSLVVSQSRSSDQSSVAEHAYASSRLDADASALGQELVVQDENSHNSVASANHHAPIVTPSLDWDRSSGAEAQASQMSMGQQNSYLAPAPMTQYQSPDPVQSMERSSFHKLAESFRKFSHASSLGESSARVTQAAPNYNADLGGNYNKDLQAAKNNQWKFALESTEWGSNSAPFKAIAQVQESLDDSDGVDPAEEEQVRQQKIAKFLGAPKQYAHYAPRAAMTQESEVDGNDNGAKFEAWIGSKKAKDLEKSYDNVMPQNQYLNNYMADLTH